MAGVAKAKGNHAEIIAKLTAAGASVDEGRTALAWPARAGRAALVEALLAAGANATARDAKGKTPLDPAKDDGCVRALRRAVT